MVSLPNRDRARHLGERALVLRRAGFEELGHARQAARDVARLLAFDRDPGQHFAWPEVLSVADLDQRADREADRHRVVGAGDLHFVAGFVEQLDLRANDLRRAAPLRIDHDQRRETRDLVQLLGDRDAFLDVLEARLAGELRDDRSRQRVPVGQHGAGLELLVGLDAEQSAVRHLVALALAAMRVGDDDLAGAGNHDQLALAVGHVAHRRVEADGAVRLRIDARGHRRTRRRTTDVERAHRELRARLADRLRRDHADRLADVDQPATTEVAAVALGADAEARAARQRSPHLDFVDGSRLEDVEDVFVEHAARGQERLLRFRMRHLGGGHATQHAVAQALDDFAAFDQGHACSCRSWSRSLPR